MYSWWWGLVQARVEGRRKRLREAWSLCAEKGIKLGEAFYAGSQINPTQAQALPTRDPVRPPLVFIGHLSVQDVYTGCVYVESQGCTG